MTQARSGAHGIISFIKPSRDARLIYLLTQIGLEDVTPKCALHSEIVKLQRHTTPISILLSESGEPPLELRRHLLNNRFIIRNFSWRDNPFIPKLELLVCKYLSVRRNRSLRSSLVAAYQGLGDVLSMVVRSVRPSYFDWAWQSVNLPIDIDFETGHVFKN